MKISRKFGLLDILIIMILIGGAVFLLKTVSSSSENKESTAESSVIEYTFETQSVEQDFVDSLEIGDEIFHSIKNEKIGVLKDFTVEPFKIEHRNPETGTIDIVENPKAYRVLMRIEAEAMFEEEEEKIMVGSEDIRVGLSLPVKSLGYATYGYIVEIEN